MPLASRRRAGRAALLVATLPIAFSSAQVAAQQQPAPYTLEQIKSYPFPNELTAAATGSRIAWALNERGVRNVFVAEGPDFRARQLTSYRSDDGQELTSVSVSPDGRYVVYVRGGEHGSNWDDLLPANPASMPVAPKLGLWSVPFGGGEAKLLAEGGDEPAISPRGDVVAFVKERQLWLLPALRDLRQTDSWAGLRPAGQARNYVLGWSERVPAMYNVAAIRSTGLSSCLGLSEHVVSLLAERGLEFETDRHGGRTAQGHAAPILDGDPPRPWWERLNTLRRVSTA